MTSPEQTHTVEKAYGVVHEGQYDVGGLYNVNFAVYPSPELLKDLSALPKDSVIGIEDFNPNQVKRLTMKINGRSFKMSKSSQVYWDVIKSVCSARGLNIAYLDDFATFRDYTAKLFEQIDSNTAISALTEPEDQANEEMMKEYYRKWRDLREAGYKANTEGQFIHEVLREEKILNNIYKYRPRLVVIGRSHGDIFVSDRKILAEKGLVISDYSREAIESSFEALDWLYPSYHKGPEIRYAHLEKNNQPDPKDIIGRELLLRRHRAVTQGRIIDGLRPDYIGTWDLGCRPQGLFEMYVNGQAEGTPFSGTIEDSLGTADFEGEIDGNWIQFLKAYIPGNCSAQARADVPILYEGYFNPKGGYYEGEYSYQGWTQTQRFSLNKA
jgi:hypothetical protein